MNQKAKDPRIESVDFSELILGFSSAALYYMGHQTSEGTSEDINTALALQNIKIIEMLKLKSKGNLTTNELILIDKILLDLNEKYNELEKKS
ncbi:MAG: hypothetical protein CMP11_00495 [Zetaproteobacteria bacterium]|nr:hypothetical protein [Pseudobdellovibrionaceae bacterium]|tara:strand:- start:1724 stop:1999 length:276 start_codon:yes stop_codon:yes gene_type:complete